MIDPEPLGPMHLLLTLRREPDDWARDDGDRAAIYALVYRRRARGAATRAAVATALSCLFMALLMSAPWMAIAGFVACPIVYIAADWTLERRLIARLGVSHAALAACIERFMASPQGAEKAALLERADAVVNLERRHRSAPE